VADNFKWQSSRSDQTGWSTSVSTSVKREISLAGIPRIPIVTVAEFADALIKKKGKKTEKCVLERAKRNVHSILETLSGRKGREERLAPWILFRTVRATKISSFRTFNVPEQYLNGVYIPPGKHLKYREQLVSQERRRYFAQQSRKRISTAGCTFMCRWRPIFFCFSNIFQCHKACHAGHRIVSGPGCIFARFCECRAREFHLIPAEKRTNPILVLPTRGTLLQIDTRSAV